LTNRLIKGIPGRKWQRATSTWTAR
jgi:hypothetical protein